MCPSCKRNSRCGCRSCKTPKKISSLRAFTFINGDFIKCPYCRKTAHVDAWANEEYKKYNKEFSN